MDHTMRKSLEIIAREWCHKLRAFLLAAAPQRCVILHQALRMIDCTISLGVEEQQLRVAPVC